MTLIIFFGTSNYLTLRCRLNDKGQRWGATPNNRPTMDAERFCRVWSEGSPGFFIPKISIHAIVINPKYILN